MDGLQISLFGKESLPSGRFFDTCPLWLLLRLQKQVGQSMGFSFTGRGEDSVDLLLRDPYLQYQVGSAYWQWIHDTRLFRRAKVLEAIKEVARLEQVKVFRRWRIWFEKNASPLPRGGSKRDYARYISGMAKRRRPLRFCLRCVNRLYP